MFTEFLWFLSAKQQHDRQMEQGLAGFMGIVITIFTVFIMIIKWDTWFHPFFQKTGLEGFAERVGLIHELPVLTIINIAGVLFVIFVFFSLAAAALAVIAMLLIVIGSTEKGATFLAIAGSLLFLPIWLPFVIVELMKHKKNLVKNPTLISTYKSDPVLKPLLKKYGTEEKQLMQFHLYQEQIQRTKKSAVITALTPIEAKAQLNRAVSSLEKDRQWTFGYDKEEEQWYILFPTPLPDFASSYGAPEIFMDRSLGKFKRAPLQLEKAAPLFVPALTIEFEWETNQIVVRELENARMALKNTEIMVHFSIESEEVSTLFNRIAGRKDVCEWIQYIHILAYVITIAFPPHINKLNNDTYDVTFKRIRNAKNFYQIYAFDVLNMIKTIAKADNAQWARDWLANA